MRRRVIIFIVSTAVIFLSCRREQFVRVNGTVQGYDSRKLFIYSVDSVFKNRLSGVPIDSVVTDSLGCFTFNLHSQNAKCIYFIADDKSFVTTLPFILEGSKELEITLSHYNSLDIELNGKNAEINRFLFFVRSKLDRDFRNPDIFTQPYSDFTSQVLKVKGELNAKLDSITATNPISQWAVNLVRAEIELKIAHLIQKGALYNYSVQMDSISLLSLQSDWIDDGKSSLEQFTDYWFLPVYTQYAQYYVDGWLEMTKTKDYSYIDFAYYLNFANKYLNGIPQKVVIASATANTSQFLYSPSFFDNLNSADSLMKSPVSAPTLNKYLLQWRNRVIKLKPGELAPNFELNNSKGEPVELIEFKGKVVFLAFWATWCGPCLVATEKHLKLQERYRNSDIAFIYLAMEANQPKDWYDFIEGKGKLAKEYLKEKTFPGIHLIALDKNSRKQVEPYMAFSIPSYLLIDKQGRIVRPRIQIDDKLTQQVDSLLTLAK